VRVSCYASGVISISRHGSFIVLLYMTLQLRTQFFIHPSPNDTHHTVHTQYIHTHYLHTQYTHTLLSYVFTYTYMHRNGCATAVVSLVVCHRVAQVRRDRHTASRLRGSGGIRWGIRLNQGK
jgi:hypothetical protein